jgi:SNF2 family DNA or RNA helicase
LHALLQFVDKENVPSSSEFLQKYIPDNVESIERLQSVLRQYVLRRQKHDVEASIPPKEETVVEFELTEVQKHFYRAIFDKVKKVGAI